MNALFKKTLTQKQETLWHGGMLVQEENVFVLIFMKAPGNKAQQKLKPDQKPVILRTLFVVNY